MSKPAEHKINCSAWELAGDWWWVGKFRARAINGNVLYETATATRTQKAVVLRRAEGLRTISRRVKPHQRMVLKPL